MASQMRLKPCPSLFGHAAPMGVQIAPSPSPKTRYNRCVGRRVRSEGCCVMEVFLQDSRGPFRGFMGSPRSRPGSGRSHPARSAPAGSELHGARSAEEASWVDRRRACSTTLPDRSREWSDYRSQRRFARSGQLVAVNLKCPRTERLARRAVDHQPQIEVPVRKVDQVFDIERGLELPRQVGGILSANPE